MKPKVYIYKINDGFLVCNATGSPPPRLTWYKDNQAFQSNINNEKSLKIKHTAGNLTCVARNSAGTSSRSYPSYIAGKHFICKMRQRYCCSCYLVLIFFSLVGRSQEIGTLTYIYKTSISKGFYQISRTISTTG